MCLKYLVSFCVAGLMATPSLAQSSLGISALDLRFGYEDAYEQRSVGLSGSIDVAITEYHGFQGDVDYLDGAGGAIGRVGAHLYMSPEPVYKYGLFAFAGDVDGAEMFYGAVGAEGMIALTETTTIEMRAGAGMADQNGLDFVFGGLGVTQDVGDSLRFGVQLEVAEFDEAAFEAIGTELTLSARYSPPGSGLGRFAEVGRHDLSGTSGAPAEITVRAGLSLELGRAGAKGPRGTRFRSPDPIAQLVRRGLY